MGQHTQVENFLRSETPSCPSRGSEIVQNLDEEELAEPKLQVQKPSLYLYADGTHEKCQIIVYHTIYM